jgi:hypothetical protein
MQEARRQWNSELGIRPPASPSCRLYEPEAIGAYAYAPAGKRKIKAKSLSHRAEVFEFGNRNVELKIMSKEYEGNKIQPKLRLTKLHVHSDPGLS